MRAKVATALWIFAAAAFAGSIGVFTFALFPWSLLMLGIPVFIVVCWSIARER